MITTEQEARAAVAKVGFDVIHVAILVSERFFDGQMPPAVISFVANIYAEQRHPRKSAQLRRIATEWAAARGAAK